MCAEASTILRAVAADLLFNCWYLEIPSGDRIRHIPRCVHYHAKLSIGCIEIDIKLPSSTSHTQACTALVLPLV
jgi:hypothetical protein